MAGGYGAGEGHGETSLSAEAVQLNAKSVNRGGSYGTVGRCVRMLGSRSLPTDVIAHWVLSSSYFCRSCIAAPAARVNYPVENGMVCCEARHRVNDRSTRCSMKIFA